MRQVTPGKGGDHNSYRLEGRVPTLLGDDSFQSLERAWRLLAGLDRQEVVADSSSDVELAMVARLIEHAQRNLPRIKCWVVADEEDKAWSGHLTQEYAQTWLSYWRAWTSRGPIRRFRVTRGVVPLLDYYHGAVAPARDRDSRGYLTAEAKDKLTREAQA